MNSISQTSYVSFWEMQKLSTTLRKQKQAYISKMHRYIQMYHSRKSKRQTTLEKLKQSYVFKLHRNLQIL
jgi:hypothetical protein